MAIKMQLEFDGFEKLLSKIDKMGGDVKRTTEKALTETHKIVTEKAQTAIAPHRDTGRTEASLQRNAKIEWQGDIGFVEVGFNLKEGGLPSIFLMYGTPRMRKDMKLYNAFYGKGTRDEITQIQQEIFFNEIRRLEE